MSLYLKVAAQQQRNCVLCLATKDHNSCTTSIRTQFHSSGWFHMKLCAKCMLCSRYRLLTPYYTNSCVVWQPFASLVASSGDAQQQRSLGSFETSFWEYFHRQAWA